MKKLFKSTKAFTLIELLVVIAVIGVLALAVISAINPVARINQAKDSNYKSDIAQIAGAMQTYITARGAEGTSYYPSLISDLAVAVNGTAELKSEPKPAAMPVCTTGSGTGTATNGSYCLVKNPSACTTALKTCTDVAVYAPLNAPTASGNVWCWRSFTGQASELAGSSCTAP